MKNLFALIVVIGFALMLLLRFGCSSCSSSYPSSSSYSSPSYRYEDTPEYMESINRETALRRAGYKAAADKERDERRLKMRGGYNGSEQQKKDLEEIDKRMREDPNF